MVPVAPAITMVSYDLGKLNIMVVEENDFLLKVIKDVLMEMGVQNVEKASTITEAITGLVETAPDIVIADWAPGLDGIRLIKEIRNEQNSPYPMIPIIMVTAYTEAEHVCSARDAGMSAYLAKPLTAKVIYSRISSLVKDERLFVNCTDFFGPDRRRRRLEFSGRERRSNDNHAVTVAQRDRLPSDRSEMGQKVAGTAR